MRLEELSDKLEIHELLARYCLSLDQKDWPSFSARFTDDALTDFTAFGGPQGSVDDLQAFLVPILDNLAGLV